MQLYDKAVVLASIGKGNEYFVEKQAGRDFPVLRFDNNEPGISEQLVPFQKSAAYPKQNSYTITYNFRFMWCKLSYFFDLSV
ncbi:MAG TPA: hypothetical protein VEZ13_19320 [Brevibacillus sp.]|nr:hypothetical protein [Brevibacillus sp.]